MGLPKIFIEFKNKAQTLIQRSERGIVAVILKDDTEGTKKFAMYSSLNDVEFTKMSEVNYKYLKLIFEGMPAKVIAVTIPTTTEDGYSSALTTLANYKWNYLTVPSADTETVTSIASWLKEQNTTKKKTFKAVLANNKADHESIINLTSTNIVSSITGEEPLTAYQYTARIAGLLAGLSLERSATYYDLTDIISCDIYDDPDTRIDAGELIFIYDGESYKIARGVNSLTNAAGSKSGDLKKIKIVEVRDMVNEDIHSTFENEYIGKLINDYDNKQSLVAAIISYFKTIEGNALDKNYDNTCSISLAKQKAYLEANGVDTTTMTDAAILQANTGSNVFLDGQIKIVDAMEDMGLSIAM